MVFYIFRKTNFDSSKDNHNMSTVKTANLNQLSDWEIVQLSLRNKSDQTFNGEIYNRYYNRVYFKSLQILKTKEDTKDVVHDIFVSILNNLGTIENKEAISSWIFAITYNTCANFLKKTKRFSTDDDATLYLSETPEDINSDLKELKLTQLNLVLTQLNSEDRLLLLMHYYDEFSVKEIATFIQISESAVKMRMKRTRDKMKQMINELNR